MVRPEDVSDHFSVDDQIALASRMLRELATLDAGARAAGESLPTIAMDVEMRFADPKQRAESLDELLNAEGELVLKYHDDEAERTYRFQVGGYALPKGPAD